MLLILALLTSIIPAHAQEPYNPQGPSAPGGQQDTSQFSHSITFNGRALNAMEQATLQQLEMMLGFQLPSGAYWYDPTCGAIGLWGQPPTGYLPPGLQLGGAVPVNASEGGTGIYINGREIHPIERQQLLMLLGAAESGHYFFDSSGNWGLENGPVQGNVFQMAEQSSGEFSVYTQHSGVTMTPNSGTVCNSSGECAFWNP